MIYTFRALLAVVLAVALCSAANLWPQPVFSEIGNEYIPVSQGFRWLYGGNSPVLAAAMGRNVRGVRGGCKLFESEGLNHCKVVVANEEVPLNFGVDESYSVSIDGTDCTITAETVWGALHGMETVSQLVETDETGHCGKKVSSSVRINDYPRYPHRGILLDTSRHFVPVRDIKTTIDALAMNKMNVLHWHLVDAQSFPYDAPSAPEAVKGAYAPNLVYPHETVQEIVEYATSKGVRVSFELDVPGHAASWGKGYPNIVADCPSYSANINNIPLHPGLQETYDVLQGVLNDVHAATADAFTHLGGDEVVYSCWKQDARVVAWKEAQGLSSWDDVYCAFVDAADKMVRDAGRIPVHWEETFLTKCNLDRENTIIQVWIDQETIANVTASGFRTIASPQAYWYLDHLTSTWDVMYSYEPTAGLTAAQQENLIGGEACSWSETQDSSNIHSRIWPRASAVAERLWSPKETVDTTAAKTRLAEHHCRMKARGVPSTPIGPGFCPTDDK